MNHRITIIATCLAALGTAICLSEESPSGEEASSSVLWWDKPAAKWEEAMPVGNGKLGAMIFGQPVNERIQLNEGTLWAGGPYDPVNPDANAALPEVR